MKMTKFTIYSLVLLPAVLLMGCAGTGIPMADPASTLNAKMFKQPPPGRAGIYIYRDDGPFNFDKSRFERRLWIDSTCVGKSAPNIFFYTHLPGNTSYTFSSESVLLINNVTVNVEADKNYFFEQIFHEEYPFKNVGRTSIRHVPNFIGESKISKLNMANFNDCE